MGDGSVWCIVSDMMVTVDILCKREKDPISVQGIFSFLGNMDMDF